MVRLNKFSFFFILVLILASCHKDEEYSDSQIISTFTATVVKEINGSILGYVFDENNQPVVDAIVQTYSTSTKTNKFGTYYIKNAKMDKQGTYIKVIKDGYFLGSDLVYPSEKALTYSYVNLMKLDNNLSFDSKNGGSIAIVGGGKIEFAPNTIMKSNGEVYEGKVLVTAKFLNPSDVNLGDKMPGDLIADAANGNTVVLGTLGMVAVNLMSESGAPLQIATGKKASLSLPAKTKNKPATIPLWYF